MKIKNWETFNETKLGNKKIEKLKEIGFTEEQINDLVDFLFMSDEELSKVKLTSLKNAPKKIKSLYDGEITSLKTKKDS